MNVFQDQFDLAYDVLKSKSLLKMNENEIKGKRKNNEGQSICCLAKNV